MLAKGLFLVSFNIGNLGFCEPVKISYRTEELLPYLRYPSEVLNPDDLHYRSAMSAIHDTLGDYPTEILDIIRI